MVSLTISESRARNWIRSNDLFYPEESLKEDNVNKSLDEWIDENEKANTSQRRKRQFNTLLSSIAYKERKEVEIRNREYEANVLSRIERANVTSIYKVEINLDYEDYTISRLENSKESKIKEFQEKAQEARRKREEERTEQFRKSGLEGTREEIKRAGYRKPSSYARYYNLTTAEAEEVWRREGLL